MDKRIAIILTSIERPLALHRCLESIIAVWQDNWVLMIGLQDTYDSKSFEVVAEIIRLNPEKEIRLYDLEYDCGISVARNELINKAAMWGHKYVLLTADSIVFDESMMGLETVTNSMETLYIDLCGLNLNNRIPWEAILNLIPGQSFELDFIDPKEKEKYTFVDCDIVRNFWIAKTESVFKVPYDEQLIMVEHEDFFYRYKEAGYSVCCTNLCSGIYNKPENTPKYDKIRANNFRIGMQRLKDKYFIKGWVRYVNLDRTQR